MQVHITVCIVQCYRFYIMPYSIRLWTEKKRVRGGYCGIFQLRTIFLLCNTWLKAYSQLIGASERVLSGWRGGGGGGEDWGRIGGGRGAECERVSS